MDASSIITHVRGKERLQISMDPRLPKEFYVVMTTCWEHEANLRPTMPSVSNSFMNIQKYMNPSRDCMFLKHAIFLKLKITNNPIKNDISL